MHAPYGIDGGWDESSAEVAGAMLSKWTKAEPNLSDAGIVRSRLETLEDIELRLAHMRRG